VIQNLVIAPKRKKPLQKFKLPSDSLACKGGLSMNKFKSFSKRLLKNSKGQGMVEYILILTVVVAIVLAMKGQLKNYVSGEMFSNLTGQLGNVMSDQ
jgi:Flp pilus assembly pilin Flp